jgi:hypothetical protein
MFSRFAANVETGLLALKLPTFLIAFWRLARSEQ